MKMGNSLGYLFLEKLIFRKGSRIDAHGCASLACFEDQILAYLCLVECDDDDAYVDTVIKKSHQK